MENIVITCSDIMVKLWILSSRYQQQNGSDFSKL